MYVKRAFARLETVEWILPLDERVIENWRTRGHGYSRAAREEFLSWRNWEEMKLKIPDGLA